MDPNDYYPNSNLTNNESETQTNDSTPPPYVTKSNGMAVASMTLGIASIVLLCCSGAGFPLGALGIIFALLSRSDRHMNTQAKAGLGLSIGGIVLSILTVITSFVILLASGTFTDMLNIMNQYDITTQSGLEDFLEDWEDYMYDETSYDEVLPNGNSDLFIDDYI